MNNDKIVIEISQYLQLQANAFKVTGFDELTLFQIYQSWRGRYPILHLTCNKKN